MSRSPARKPTNRYHKQHIYQAYKQATSGLNTYGLAVPGITKPWIRRPRHEDIPGILLGTCPGNSHSTCSTLLPAPCCTRPCTQRTKRRSRPFAVPDPCRPQPAPFPALAEDSSNHIHSTTNIYCVLTSSIKGATPYNSDILGSALHTSSMGTVVFLPVSRAP